MLPFDIAPVYNNEGVRENLASFGFRRIAHPPYSPDLARCDFFLFAAMKQAVAGQHFATIDDLLMSVQAFLRGLSAHFLQTVFRNGYSDCSKYMVSTWSVEHDLAFCAKFDHVPCCGSALPQPTALAHCGVPLSFWMDAVFLRKLQSGIRLCETGARSHLPVWPKSKPIWSISSVKLKGRCLADLSKGLNVFLRLCLES
jgi:hypothetical protein